MTDKEPLFSWRSTKTNIHDPRSRSLLPTTEPKVNLREKLAGLDPVQITVGLISLIATNEKFKKAETLQMWMSDFLNYQKNCGTPDKPIVIMSEDQAKVFSVGQNNEDQAARTPCTFCLTAPQSLSEDLISSPNASLISLVYTVALIRAKIWNNLEKPYGAMINPDERVSDLNRAFNKIAIAGVTLQDFIATNIQFGGVDRT